MRHVAAAADAAAVCKPSGSARVVSYSASTLSMPALAAVSPNLHSGPCHCEVRKAAQQQVTECCPAQPNLACPLHSCTLQQEETVHQLRDKV